jgi:hypothetical protein
VAERLARRQNFFVQLEVLRYRIVALFGNETAKPFDELFRILTEINTAVGLLLRMRESADYSSSAVRRSLEATIGWWNDPKEDVIASRLDQIIATVEAIFRPAIEIAPHA